MADAAFRPDLIVESAEIAEVTVGIRAGAGPPGSAVKIQNPMDPMNRIRRVRIDRLQALPASSAPPASPA